MRRTYSVWMPEERGYSYFAASAASVAQSSSASIHPPLGDPPEVLLRHLPGGAFYLGRGSLARGEIVVRRRSA